MFQADDKEKTMSIPVVGERRDRQAQKRPYGNGRAGNETRAAEVKLILANVYNALAEKGYNPINQLVGYIISEDPTYITNYKGARSLITKVDRDELLGVLIKSYLGI